MQDKLVAMKAWMIAEESELEEQKKVLSEYKAAEKSVDDLVDDFIEAVGDNLQKNGPRWSLDDETLKRLVEKASSEFTEALKKVQNLGRHAGGANIGGWHDQGSSGDNNIDVVSKAPGSTDGGKKDEAKGGGHSE